MVRQEKSGNGGKAKRHFLFSPLGIVTVLICVAVLFGYYAGLKRRADAYKIMFKQEVSVIDLAVSQLRGAVGRKIADMKGPQELSLERPPYKTYFSGYMTRSSLGRYFWMDNQHIIFTGKPRDRKPDVYDIYIWEIGGAVTKYRTNTEVACYADGRIIFTSGDRREFFYGKMGEEARIDMPAYTNEYDCTPMAENPLRAHPPWMPLHKDDGTLHLAREIDPETGNPFLEYRKADGKTVALPFPVLSGGGYLVYPADYYQFEKAYLIPNGMATYPEDKPRRYWWLYSSGEVKSFEVPAPWGVWDAHFPTKAGFFYHGRDMRQPLRQRQMQVFLFKEWVPVQLMKDNVIASGVKVSPDGCRVAFIALDLIDSRWARDLLYVIDVCSPSPDHPSHLP